jgi:hypothetical protein
MKPGEGAPAPLSSSRPENHRIQALVYSVRIRDIAVKVWDEFSAAGSLYRVVPQRSCLDSSGKPALSTAFGVEDPPLLMRALDAAYGWILEQEDAAVDAGRST